MLKQRESKLGATYPKANDVAEALRKEKEALSKEKEALNKEGGPIKRRFDKQEAPILKRQKITFLGQPQDKWPTILDADMKNQLHRLEHQIQNFSWNHAIKSVNRCSLKQRFPTREGEANEILTEETWDILALRAPQTEKVGVCATPSVNRVAVSLRLQRDHLEAFPLYEQIRRQAISIRRCSPGPCLLRSSKW